MHQSLAQQLETAITTSGHRAPSFSGRNGTANYGRHSRTALDVGSTANARACAQYEELAQQNHWHTAEANDTEDNGLAATIAAIGVIILLTSLLVWTLATTLQVPTMT